MPGTHSTKTTQLMITKTSASYYRVKKNTQRKPTHIHLFLHHWRVADLVTVDSTTEELYFGNVYCGDRYYIVKQRFVVIGLDVWW